MHYKTCKMNTLYQPLPGLEPCARPCLQCVLPVHGVAVPLNISYSKQRSKHIGRPGVRRPGFPAKVVANPADQTPPFRSIIASLERYEKCAGWLFLFLRFLSRAATAARKLVENPPFPPQARDRPAPGRRDPPGFSARPL